MFNNLDEQIEDTVGDTSTRVEKLLRYLMILVISVIVFGGLFLGVWFLEY